MPKTARAEATKRSADRLKGFPVAIKTLRLIERKGSRIARFDDIVKELNADCNQTSSTFALLQELGLLHVRKAGNGSIMEMTVFAEEVLRYLDEGY